MGSNMAENHPVGFRWPMKARERGATIIHVDPRFSRTSASANKYVQIRAGTDIAFLGGLINYVLTHDCQETEELGGIFSGYDLEQRAYNAGMGHWAYKDSPSAKEHEGKPR